MNIQELETNYPDFKFINFENPLELLTHNEIRLIGVTNIGINFSRNIIYVLGERIIKEEESNFIILNYLQII